MSKKKPRENIWAPWRIEYILGTKDEQKNSCIFCDRYPQKDDRRNLILHRGEKVFVIMNRFPYNSGHLMVVPYRHSGNILDLEDGENREIMSVIQLSIQVLHEVMLPDGFNVGMNLGRVSGAGVENHLHFHIVPRWNGDTNFMPVISDTKVVSEALDRTYDKLLAVFDSRRSR